METSQWTKNGLSCRAGLMGFDLGFQRGHLFLIWHNFHGQHVTFHSNQFSIDRLQIKVDRLWDVYNYPCHLTRSRLWFSRQPKPANSLTNNISAISAVHNHGTQQIITSKTCSKILLLRQLYSLDPFWIVSKRGKPDNIAPNHNFMLLFLLQIQ
jgi:hypothetical protein